MRARAPRGARVGAATALAALAAAALSAAAASALAGALAAAALAASALAAADRSGDDTGGATVEEELRVDGKVTYDGKGLSLWVYAFPDDTGDSRYKGTVTYSYSKIDPCPS